MKKTELDGFCPVTYRDNEKTYESLVRGSDSFGVEFKSKTYLMSSDMNQQKFLRRPNDYIDMVLPSKASVQNYAGLKET
jgi:YHS domain-containing protein